MGRPTSCTPELIEMIAKGVRGGLSIERICNLSCVSTASYKSWKNKGILGEEPYVSFLAAIKKAEAEWIQEKQNDIEEAGRDKEINTPEGMKIVRGDWKAIAWLLERKYRSEFGRFISKIELPEPPDGLSEIQKLMYLSEEIVRKMGKGEITAEEANSAAQVLEQRRKILETGDLAKRIESVEKILQGVK